MLVIFSINRETIFCFSKNEDTSLGRQDRVIYRTTQNKEKKKLTDTFLRSEKEDMTGKKRTVHLIYHFNEYKTPSDQADVFLIAHDKRNGSN